MKGTDEINKRFQKKIENTLRLYPELNGFYYFLGNKSIRTTNTYIKRIATFIEYTGKRNFSELMFDDFSGFMIKMKTNLDGSSATSSQMIGAYSALKKFGKYLVASEQLPSNPMDHIDRPKPVESQETIKKRELGYLEKKEINKFVGNIDIGVGSHKARARQEKWKERDLAIVMIFLNTGMRCSALISLDITDVDFTNNTVIVTDKGSKVTKYELTDELMSIIKKWIEKRNEILKDIQEDALFISNRKQRISDKAVEGVVRKYASNIEGKNISPHKLRATFGTQVLNATGDLYLTQQAMGHSSPKTTELYIRGQKNPTKKTSEIMKNLTMKNLKDL